MTTYRVFPGTLSPLYPHTPRLALPGGRGPKLPGGLPPRPKLGTKGMIEHAAVFGFNSHPKHHGSGGYEVSGVVTDRMRERERELRGCTDQ